jgi:chaperone modulatory protein CbpM
MPEFVIETEFFTETEVLVALPRLTPPRLTAFVASGVVLPLTVASGTGAGLAFRRIDLARLELLCELVEDGLGLVIRLVDQLHATRRDLNRLCAAVAEEDLEVRRRLSKKLAPTE